MRPTCFYLGAKALLTKKAVLGGDSDPQQRGAMPSRLKLFKSAFLTAATNPKAAMFLYCAVSPIHQPASAAGAAIFPGRMLCIGPVAQNHSAVCLFLQRCCPAHRCLWGHLNSTQSFLGVIFAHFLYGRADHA